LKWENTVQTRRERTGKTKAGNETRGGGDKQQENQSRKEERKPEHGKFCFPEQETQGEEAQKEARRKQRATQQASTEVLLGHQ
jgi:hypothetical protein